MFGVPNDRAFYVAANAAMESIGVRAAMGAIPVRPLDRTQQFVRGMFDEFGLGYAKTSDFFDVVVDLARFPDVEHTAITNLLRWYIKETTKHRA